MYKFGDGRFYWLLDFPMSYHQILVNKKLCPKLVFVGPRNSIYTYGVMPFDPGNGLVIFIWMILNINGE